MRRYEARALGRGSGSPGRASWLRLALLGAIAIGLALAACQHQPSAAPGGLYAPCDVDSQLPLLGYEVVATLPHDPAAYTQGLLLHEGVLYESTGLYGRSSLRRLERASGREFARVELPARLFGEGLALVQDRLYQLSWREGEVRFYSLEDLRLLTTLRIAGEGWGLEYDGHSLIQTDGSAELIFRHPDDLAELRRLPVRANGQPVAGLNELELVDGWLLANVYPTDCVAVIDPGSGLVAAWLDLHPLAAALRRRAPGAEVSNGIAYDAASGHLLVTGKRWPQIYEIRLSGWPPAAPDRP